LYRAAELLTSLPQGPDDDRGPTAPPKTSPLVGDPHELELEAREHDQFLLARTFFDCREYDRCSAVFLPSTRPRIPVTPSQTTPSKLKHAAKGKEKSTARLEPLQPLSSSLANVSQKALFLSIYSKYLAGEKRRDEDSEMILGPADGGVTLNRELPDLISLLDSWLGEQEAEGSNGGGWLEYLYGILLAKNKSEDAAKEWFLKSVHLYPFNWGAWQELSNLQNNSEEVSNSFKRRTI
jgi:anaphase-promoting complex subunit 8